VPLDSPLAFMLVLQQMVIGLALGFSVRVVFAAVEFAGEVIGLQMGLNFAGFFDPVSAATGTATSRFFGTTIAWLFIVSGGHLLVIAALVQSFDAFPVGPEPFAFLKTVQPQRWGSEIFALGLWIALPLVAMLLLVNLVLGLISRVAAQINVFSVGFPVTLGVGLVGACCRASPDFAGQLQHLRRQAQSAPPGLAEVDAEGQALRLGQQRDGHTGAPGLGTGAHHQHRGVAQLAQPAAQLRRLVVAQHQHLAGLRLARQFDDADLQHARTHVASGQAAHFIVAAVKARRAQLQLTACGQLGPLRVLRETQYEGGAQALVVGRRRGPDQRERRQAQGQGPADAREPLRHGNFSVAIRRQSLPRCSTGSCESRAGASR
jgi:flagellar biosynthetic protein FliR